MSEESVESRLGRLEAHMEHLRGDVQTLLARPTALGEIAGFMRAHWVKVVVLVVTLTGANWAAPILAALK